MKKVILIGLSIVLAFFIIIILVGMLAGGLIPFAPSCNKVDRYSKNNIEGLSNVAEALL